MKKSILIVLLVAALFIICVLAVSANAGISEKDNIRVVKGVMDVFKTRNLDTLDELMEPKLAAQGKAMFQRWWKKFAQVNVTIDDMFAVGDQVAMRYTFNGLKDTLNQEDWTFKHVTIWKVVDGKVAHIWIATENMMPEYVKHGFTMKSPEPKTMEGKIRATKADMATIGLAIASYIEDYSKAPKAESIVELARMIQPFYIRTCPTADAWTAQLYYKYDKKNPKNYWIGSSGSDLKFKGFHQKGVWNINDADKGNDIVFHNGTFIYHPDLK